MVLPLPFLTPSKFKENVVSIFYSKLLLLFPDVLKYELGFESINMKMVYKRGEIFHFQRKQFSRFLNDRFSLHKNKNLDNTDHEIFNQKKCASKY